MVGAIGRAERFAADLQAHVETVRSAARALPRRPRVYFEEWDDPQISAIRWVSEVIGIAGGDDIFPSAPPARWDATASSPIPPRSWPRARHHPGLVVRQEVSPRARAARPGWGAIPAVRDGELHEVKSPIILQPGPAALTDGLDAIARIVAAWSANRGGVAA
jgi:iron complex transport system substrate-binding protein